MLWQGCLDDRVSGRKVRGTGAVLKELKPAMTRDSEPVITISEPHKRCNFLNDAVRKKKKARSRDPSNFVEIPVSVHMNI